MRNSGELLPCSSLILNYRLTSSYPRRWVLEELGMVLIIVSVLILPSPSFIVFVAAPHPFGVIVTFFIGCFMVTGGRFSHLASQIMKLPSLLLCGRPTSRANRLISYPLIIFIMQLSPMEIWACQFFCPRFIFHPLGASHSVCLYLLL